MFSVDELLNQFDNNSEPGSDDEGNIEEIEDNQETEEQNDNNGDDENTEVKKEVKKPKKKSTRPKLDVERLKGPTGLCRMEEVFSTIQYKGHGHESEDLDMIMAKLQYWCHRLFPKYTFDDTLAQLEKLGNKKPVMVLKKKIVMGMYESEEPIRMEDDEEEIQLPEQPETNFSDFDAILNEPLPIEMSHPTAVQLTEEQKLTIARNRLLAAEKRKARLDAQTQSQSDTFSQQHSNSNDFDSQMSDSTLFSQNSVPELMQQDENVEAGRIVESNSETMDEGNDDFSTQSTSINLNSNTESTQFSENLTTKISSDVHSIETVPDTMDSSETH